MTQRKYVHLAIYKRVSTLSQEMQLQDYAIAEWLKRHSETHRAMYEFVDDGVSAGAKKRPAFERMLKTVDAGKVDAVLVWRFDRAGRSTRQLIELLERFKARNVDFISLTENIDTSTPAGKLMFTLIAGLAEFEKALVSERTKAGLAAVKASGKKLGHAHKLTAEQQAEVRRLVAAGERQTTLAKQFGVSQSVISQIGGTRRGTSD